MGQKKIKRSKTGSTEVDPNLAEVDEERAMEFDIDEEEKEIVLVHHYRRKWGDEVDADIDHLYTVEAAEELVSVLIRMIEELKRLKIIERDERLLQISKLTPIPIEGNPLQGPNNIEGK
jgi:hypothetical protein